MKRRRRAAIAARASTGTNSRSPPDELPARPVACTDAWHQEMIGARSPTQDRPIAACQRPACLAKRNAALVTSTLQLLPR